MPDPMNPGTDANGNGASPEPRDPATAGEGPAPAAAAAMPPETPLDIPYDQLKQIAAHLQGELEAAHGRLEEQKSQSLRLMADMENLRKRTEREREETAKYAVTRFAKDITEIGDNFQRAIQAVPIAAADQDPALKSFLDGVVVAERAFLSTLERHGVRQIAAQGQPFNPHQHQAVTEIEDASVPAGTVVQVFQAGYMIEDRCLRPAMVAVSKGGPKPGTAG